MTARGAVPRIYRISFPLKMILPQELVDKILQYNSHPIADLIRNTNYHKRYFHKILGIPRNVPFLTYIKNTRMIKWFCNICHKVVLDYKGICYDCYRIKVFRKKKFVGFNISDVI